MNEVEEVDGLVVYFGSFQAVRTERTRIARLVLASIMGSPERDEADDRHPSVVCLAAVAYADELLFTLARSPVLAFKVREAFRDASEAEAVAAEERATGRKNAAALAPR